VLNEFGLQGSWDELEFLLTEIECPFFYICQLHVKVLITITALVPVPVRVPVPVLLEVFSVKYVGGQSKMYM